MNIVFTGPCEMYTRNEFKAILDENCFTVQSSVSRKTDLLITNDFDSGTGKIRKAQELNTPIMKYKEFLYEHMPEYLIWSKPSHRSLKDGIII